MLKIQWGWDMVFTATFNLIYYIFLVSDPFVIFKITNEKETFLCIFHFYDTQTEYMSQAEIHTIMNVNI